MDKGPGWGTVRAGSLPLRFLGRDCRPASIGRSVVWGLDGKFTEGDIIRWALCYANVF
jgi:hypothetical protein